MKQEESKDDSIKRSNEFELQAATQGPIRNDRHTHTCTRGIGHHVFSCCDIGRVINRNCLPTVERGRAQEDCRSENYLDKKNPYISILYLMGCLSFGRELFCERTSLC
jgi:hypothetical protein